LDDTWNGRGGGGSQTLVGVIFGVPAVVTSYCTRGGRRSSVTGIYFQFTNKQYNLLPGLDHHDFKSGQLVVNELLDCG